MDGYLRTVPRAWLLYSKEKEKGEKEGDESLGTKQPLSQHACMALPSIYQSINQSSQRRFSAH